MKAAVVERPGELRVRELSMPVPGRYEVLTEQLFGGICAATDRHLIAGELPIPGIAYPLILGHESIGRVVETGHQVRYLKPGDLVTRTGAPALDDCQPFWGGLAEYGIARDVRAMQEDGIAETEWAPFAVNRTLPAGTDAAAATMVITWRETYSYISRLGVIPDARVLILGSGGNGFSFAVLAQALGAAEVAMLGNPHWQAQAGRAGVAAFADYRTPEACEILSAANPQGYDLIIDAVGHTAGLEAVVPLLRSGGAVGMYGIEALRERLAYLKSLADSGVRVHGPGEYSEAEAHDAVVALLERGLLDASLWFDTADAVPLDRIGDAMAALAARQSLKAVIRLSN